MRAKPIIKKCESCGKDMITWPCKIIDGRGRYCSRQCKANTAHLTAKRPATRENGHHRFEYQTVAEKVLGRPLRKGEVIHHIDGNPQHNQKGNLVVCNQTYHRLLHARTYALAESGNANAKKCVYCKKWDIPENMVLHGSRDSSMRHRSCFYGKAVNA